MNQEDRTLLNGYYTLLEQRRKRMQTALTAVFPTTTGWFNGHYRRDETGEYTMDCFPIPEITVKGLCDVELHFDMTNVTTKMRREDVLTHDLAPFAELPFEAYGVEDYLLDFRTNGISVDEMRKNICRSGETEIFFSFSFDAEVEARVIAAFARQLESSGFYY